MTDEELQEIRDRVDAAIEGPWQRHSYASSAGLDTTRVNMWPPCYSAKCEGGPRINEHQVELNAEFIAHSRTDVPNLLNEVERLKKTLTSFVEVMDKERAREIQTSCEHHYADDWVEWWDCGKCYELAPTKAVESLKT